MNRTDFNHILNLIEPEVSDTENRRAFVETALYGCGVLKKINWDGPEDVFAYNLVKRLMDYGECEPGKPALVMLLEEIKTHKGVNYHQEIAALIDMINADPIPTRELRTLLDDETSERKATASNRSMTLWMGMGAVALIALTLGGLGLKSLIPIFTPTNTPSIPTTAPLVALMNEGAAIEAEAGPSAEPPVMSRAFNIALAEFQTSQLSSASERARIKDAAANIRQTLFSMLSLEYANNEDVQIESKNMGVVSGLDDAAQLAAKTNAHMVIYGQIQYANGQYIWTPFFYMSGRFNTDIKELIGESSFGQTIMDEEALARLILPDSQEHKRLDEQNKLLVEFTKALTYVAAEQATNAVAPIERAIRLADNYGETIGRQVVYLTASGIMRMNGDLDAALAYANAALAEDSDHIYGRAYIAIGNVYYDKGIQAVERHDYPTAMTELARAADWYRNASTLTGQGDVFLKEKANYSMGNVYISMYQVPGLAQQELAQKALDAYDYVISAYKQAVTNQNSRAPYLARMAVQAAFASGVVQSWLGRSNESIASYNLVLSITAGPSLKETAQANLNMVQTQAAMPIATPTSQP